MYKIFSKIFILFTLQEDTSSARTVIVPQLKFPSLREKGEMLN